MQLKNIIDIALSIHETKEAKLIKSYLLINEYNYIEAIKFLDEIKSSEGYYLLGISHLALGNDLKVK